ncbi:MAG: hypothetical protein IT457_01635 [Planctomycetes bacterium]|nr:hypothetical protein [Planctomycetota bacterium]
MRVAVQLAPGRSELLAGGEAAPVGKARLTRLVAEHGGEAEGIRGALELLRHALQTEDRAEDRAALAA